MHELNGLATTGPLYLYTAQGASLAMDGFYAGRSCFLLGGGPSLHDMRLELLDRPGIVTYGINNSWAVKRPNIWTCVDPAERFCIEGWKDPRITKIVPVHLAPQHLREWTPVGLVRNFARVRDVPSVLFFRQNTRFEPADFLVEPSVNWGNSEEVEDANGDKGVRSVMLAALRLAFYLGFRNVYLCGMDFRMVEGQQNYAFAQDRTQHAVKHNNRLYDVLNRRFGALAPYFDMAGFRVVNCTPESGLEAFPKMRLSDAIDEAGAGCDRPMRPEGHYDEPERYIEGPREGAD
jgi:hypothetical protein